MGGRGCSSQACSRARPRTWGARRCQARPPLPPAPSRPPHLSRSFRIPPSSLQTPHPSSSPRLGLGALPFLPDDTLQDLPLVLVQTHGKGAAVRADDLHLVHFDLRGADLEARPGQPWSPGPRAGPDLGGFFPQNHPAGARAWGWRGAASAQGPQAPRGLLSDLSWVWKEPVSREEKPHRDSPGFPDTEPAGPWTWGSPASTTDPSHRSKGAPPP